MMPSVDKEQISPQELEQLKKLEQSMETKEDLSEEELATLRDIFNVSE